MRPRITFVSSPEVVLLAVGSLFTNYSPPRPVGRAQWGEPATQLNLRLSSLHRPDGSAFLGGDVLCVDRAGRNS